MKIAFNNFLDCIEEKRVSSRVSFNIFTPLWMLFCEDFYWFNFLVWKTTLAPRFTVFFFKLIESCENISKMKAISHFLYVEARNLKDVKMFTLSFLNTLRKLLRTLKAANTYHNKSCNELKHSVVKRIQKWTSSFRQFTIKNVEVIEPQSLVSLIVIGKVYVIQAKLVFVVIIVFFVIFYEQKDNAFGYFTTKPPATGINIVMKKALKRQ